MKHKNGFVCMHRCLLNKFTCERRGVKKMKSGNSTQLHLTRCKCVECSALRMHIGACRRLNRTSKEQWTRQTPPPPAAHLATAAAAIIFPASAPADPQICQITSTYACLMNPQTIASISSASPVYRGVERPVIALQLFSRPL